MRFLHACILINMKDKEYIVWRWDKLSNHFTPVKNRSWGDRDYFNFTYVVFACIDPTDWMWVRSSRGEVLHKIVLNEEQAKHCVVAEQNFMPSIKELEDYARETGGTSIGRYDRYCAEKYPNSFIPLPDYDGQHSLPEVLIPFEVEAHPQWLRTYWLKIKARYLEPELRKHPPTFSES